MRLTPSLVLAFTTGALPGCAHAPSTEATASSCAHARLAREWQTATPRPFAGCWQTSALPGVIVLTDAPAAVDDDADQPPTFALAGDDVVARPTLRAWELLGHGLARLTWSTGFSGVTACVEATGDDRLAGELRVFDDVNPLPSPPLPVVFARVPCPP
jgi:hypothetical protein